MVEMTMHEACMLAETTMREYGMDRLVLSKAEMIDRINFKREIALGALDEAMREEGESDDAVREILDTVDVVEREYDREIAFVRARPDTSIFVMRNGHMRFQFPIDGTMRWGGELWFRFGDDGEGD